MKKFFGLIVMWTLLAAGAVAQSPPSGGTKPMAGQPSDGQAPAAAGTAKMLGTGPIQPERLLPSGLFIAIDTNGDATIDQRELRRAVAQMKKLDQDGDGNIMLWEVTGEGGLYRDFNLNLSADDFAEYQNSLFTHDKNGDGKLASSELPDAIAPLFMFADGNGDGEMDRQELTTALQNVSRSDRGSPRVDWKSTAEELRPKVHKALRQLDRNGDGKLTLDEVPLLALPVVNQGDRDNNGVLDAKELQEVAERIRGATSTMQPQQR